MGTELIPQVGDTIICLKVGKIDREDLYETTRKYWKMSLQRASKANHVLAVVDGIVKKTTSLKIGNIQTIQSMRDVLNL